MVAAWCSEALGRELLWLSSSCWVRGFVLPLCCFQLFFQQVLISSAVQQHNLVHACVPRAVCHALHRAAQPEACVAVPGLGSIMVVVLLHLLIWLSLTQSLLDHHTRPQAIRTLL